MVVISILLLILYALLDPRFRSHLRGIAITVTVLLLLPIIIRTVSLGHGIIMVRRTLGTRKVDNFTEVIYQCRPMHQTFTKKKEHAIILLHGFISTPQIFTNLLSELEECGVDYHAPLINGFGIKRVQLMFSFSEKEWIRQITELYDILASQYENVSILGHSMGGAIALYIAQVRPVKHLILIAPALFPSKSQKLHKFLANSTTLNKLIPWILPLLPIPNQARDEFDREVALKYNIYPVAPTRGVFNLLRIQSKIDLKVLQYETLDLLYGVHDSAVDGEKVREYFDGAKIFHRVHRFDDTGHNPVTDRESGFAALIVGCILSNQLSWPPEKQNIWKTDDN